MRRLYQRLACLICISAYAFLVTAQENHNPSIIERSILQGSSETIIFNTSSPIVVQNTTNVLNESYEITTTGTNIQSELRYTPPSDFEGLSTFLVEYSVAGEATRYFSRVKIKVVRSLLEANPDYVYVSQGGSVSIDPLANDIQGANGISLLSVDPASEGTVTLVNGSINYQAPADYSGIVSFNYFISDGNGFSSAGLISILVSDESIATDDLYFTIDNQNAFPILLDDPSFQLVNKSQVLLGTIEASGIAKVFSPIPVVHGEEELIFENSAGKRVHVHLTILDANEFEGLAVSDKYYSIRNQSISFDPRSNDVNPVAAILDYSPELSVIDGTFSYQASLGFSGVKHFYYTVLDGLSSYTASIDIYIGDYLPSKTSYSFTTTEGTPLVLDYDIPIFDYAWNIVKQPKHGQLDVNLDAHIPSGQCMSAFGYRMIVFQPNSNYTGTDQFTIQYCTDASSCKEVVVNVNILAKQNQDCGCFGAECVWSGDTDNDGHVSVVDLLAIGYHYGESGPMRSRESGWVAEHSDDWAFDQTEGSVNLKYVDTDGNGIINSADTIGLAQAYDQYHNLTPQNVIAQKEEAIAFVANQSSYKAGDQATFDIIVGNTEHPAADLTGLAFSFQLPSHLVDLGTIDFEFTPSDWFGSGSPVLSMFRINGSTVEASIVRTSGSGISGIGKIGSTSLVIREDVDGFRPEDQELPFEIGINSMLASDGSGVRYSLPVVSEKITVQFDQYKSEEQITQIVIYPNPSRGQLQFHANGDDQLQDIMIYNTSGALVCQQKSIASKHYDVSLDLPDGIYIARVLSDTGVTTERLNIVRD